MDEKVSWENCCGKCEVCESSLTLLKNWGWAFINGMIHKYKSFSIMCKVAHAKKFKIVSLHWNLRILY
jgi:hypothetical protein